MTIKLTYVGRTQKNRVIGKILGKDARGRAETGFLTTEFGWYELRKKKISLDSPQN